MLLGRAPSPEISKYIDENNLHETSPVSNVYEVPYFFKDYILSNDIESVFVREIMFAKIHLGI